mgnify:FL=1
MGRWRHLPRWEMGDGVSLGVTGVAAFTRSGRGVKCESSLSLAVGLDGRGGDGRGATVVAERPGLGAWSSRRVLRVLPRPHSMARWGVVALLARSASSSPRLTLYLRSPTSSAGPRAPGASSPVRGPSVRDPEGAKLTRPILRRSLPAQDVTPVRPAVV